MRNIFRNKNAVANPAQSVVAFSIVLTMVGFYFAGINGSFVTYEDENVDISAKAIDVAERILSDPGQLIGESLDWELDPENLTAIGLCIVPSSLIPINGSGSEYGYDVPGELYGSANSDTQSNFGTSNIYAFGPYWEDVTLPNGKKKRIYYGYLTGRSASSQSGFLVRIGDKFVVIRGISDLISGQSDIFQLGTYTFPPYVVSYNYSCKQNSTTILEIKSNSNFPYAVLDERKISNLTNIDYEKAKEALGIDDNYDFSITITGNNGTVLAYDSTNKYFKNGDVGSTSSSNTITVLDQSNTNGAGDEIGSYGQYLAQTFTCGQSGNLKSVELHVRNVKADEDITVKIKAVQNGKPSGDPLATATIPKFSDTSFVWKNATFSNPPSLTEGTQYAIVIEAISSRYAFEKNSNGYSSGEMGTSTDGTDWIMDSSSDLLFKTWMEVEQNNGGENNIQLPSPPIPPGNAISTCTRNVLIRHPVLDGNQFVYIYEPAQMTVRIF